MKKMKYLAAALLLGSFCLLSFISINDHRPVLSDFHKPGKFEPADGKVILFVGQELEAIGGTEKYNDGYFDHFPAAGGVTEYTNFQPGIISCGFTIKGLDGLTSLADWGDGPENMSVTINNPHFKNS